MQWVNRSNKKIKKNTRIVKNSLVKIVQKW